MNKAITDGLLLMPPPFATGLNQWSRGDGTPGSDTYQGAADAALVPADQDFAGCLELLKTEGTQKLRYMGETPLLPGCYLRITARVKAVSGNLPAVRIAGWAGGAGGVHVTGVTEIGPSVQLQTYGTVVEVSAIVGTGLRGGVDMVWGTQALYGHFGLDLTGPNGGVVRIDDIVIEDVTSAFLVDMLGRVDVRDFGARGDGSTDDSAAFEAADADANGREIFVSEGTYRLAQSVTLSSPIAFEGTLTMPDSAILSLQKSYDLPTYIDAFKNEERALQKALQALMNNSDHESLDLGGRRIDVSAPLDMARIVNNKTVYAQRRVVRNGQIIATGDTVWAPTVVTSVATYNGGANATRLTGVANIANIAEGSLVTGSGVGREVYVRDVNVGAQEIILSEPLFDADGTQTFTFTRYKYLVDFGGFDQLSFFSFENVDFQCQHQASGILLAKTGVLFHLRDCYLTRPAHRGITSTGTGCQGMLIDRCHFISPENGLPTQDRGIVAINTNGNDVKLRNNWASQFRHWAILGGGSNVVTGNHFFQGDTVTGGIRSAGIVLTKSNSTTTISTNYIDNAHIEWTNEHDPDPNYTGGFSFSGLSVTNNNFLNGNVADWFSYVVVKPYGSGHAVNGVAITGNSFKSLGGQIDRIDRVDTTFADIDLNQLRDIVIEGNSFNNIRETTQNPLYVRHDQNTAAATWTVECTPGLFLDGRAQKVLSVVPITRLRNAANQTVFPGYYVEAEKGTKGNQVQIFWQEPVHGEVMLVVSCEK